MDRSPYRTRNRAVTAASDSRNARPYTWRYALGKFTGISIAYVLSLCPVCPNTFWLSVYSPSLRIYAELRNSE